MKKEELVSYIEKELHKGFNPIRIKKKLFDAGHNLIIIEEAFEIVEKKVKRRHELIYGGIALLVIVAGMALFIHLSGTTTILTQNEVSDSQLLLDAVRNSHVESCEMISDEVLKQKCFLAVNVEGIDYSNEDILDREILIQARETDNVGLCNQITNENLRIQCQEDSTAKYTQEQIADRTLLVSAVKEKNPSICEGISDIALKDKCILLTEE